MLVEKYRPKKLVEVVGQRSVIEKMTLWLREWKPKKALLLYGPTGIGKTLITELVAKENSFNLIEINTSDDNLVSYVREVLLPASKEGSLLNKRLIMIDSVDAIADRGAIAEIIKVVKESASPVIITANNAYDSKLKTLRGHCAVIRVSRINTNLIEREIRRIARKEGIKASDDVFKRIASSSDGDMRSAINDLEMVERDFELGLRDREDDIFKTLKKVFQSKSLSEALRSMDNSDKDIDEIFWWVEQNIPLELKSNVEISQALELLSKADMFRSKITANQNYRFKKYMREMLAGITLIGNNKKFMMYRPPDRFLILGRTKAIRARNEEVYSNLGAMLHCSKRKVKEQMPFLKMFLDVNKA